MSLAMISPSAASKHRYGIHHDELLVGCWAMDGQNWESAQLSRKCLFWSLLWNFNATYWNARWITYPWCYRSSTRTTRSHATYCASNKFLQIINVKRISAWCGWKRRGGRGLEIVLENGPWWKNPTWRLQRSRFTSQTEKTRVFVANCPIYERVCWKRFMKEKQRKLGFMRTSWVLTNSLLSVPNTWIVLFIPETQTQTQTATTTVICAILVIKPMMKRFITGVKQFPRYSWSQIARENPMQKFTAVIFIEVFMAKPA